MDIFFPSFTCLHIINSSDEESNTHLFRAHDPLYVILQTEQMLSLRLVLSESYVLPVQLVSEARSLLQLQ